MDKNLITRLRLPRVKIPPKPITSFVKENTKEPGVEITEIVKFSIDIQGYRRNIFAYVVPALSNPVIIGLPWIREDNVIIKPATDTLIINSYGLTISTKETPVSSKIKELTATPFATLVKEARKRQKPLTVFKVSLKDITKALRPKTIRTPTEIQKLLPAQYHDHLPLFKGGIAAELPPHRPGINHTFTLKIGKNGQERNLPWGPLYRITRDKLLVLRKTLNELLDKGFIRASNSPAGAPVLFAKKEKGLRFCMNYRGLNNITKKNRYPLPLIKKILSGISKARYFTKLNITAIFHKIRIAKGQK